MRVSISNIAWDVPEDEDVAKLLRTAGIDAIDVAPGKYFPDFVAATKADIQTVRDRWKDRGFDIVGMQSLLYGTQGLNLFGDHGSRANMLKHLREVARIGAGLGANRLVFGSPKNRDKGELSTQAATDIALDFFARLGDIAAEEGVIFCIEPNPAQYGCNFLTNTRDAAALVAALNHAAIRLQLDAGAMAMNGEAAYEEVAAAHLLAGHIHISEPNLVPIGDGSTDHSGFSSALFQYLPDRTATIEMVATSNEPHLTAIARACSKVVAIYAGTRETA